MALYVLPQMPVNLLWLLMKAVYIAGLYRRIATRIAVRLTDRPRDYSAAFPTVVTE